MKESFNKYYNFIVVLLIALIAIAFFDRGLALGLIVLALLMIITFFLLSKLGLKDKTLFRLLIIALIIHLGAVLFIYYFDFQPFSEGTGGYKNCHIIATEISENFKQGNFSFEGVPHYENERYPYRYYGLIIGVLYTITVPEMVIGQIFGVWLAILAIIFVYLIVKELGVSKKWAFIIGLMANFYPSYLFYSSLLLKDGLIVTLALMNIFLCLRLIKNFSWKKFIVFYLGLGLLIHFRIYIGYALFFAFIVSWILLSKLNPLKKKVIYGIIIVILLGFLPEISIDQGFYGIKTFKSFFNPETLVYYQQEAYFPSSFRPGEADSISEPLAEEIKTKPEEIKGYDSSWPKPKEEIKGYDSSWPKEEISFEEKPYRYLLNEFKYFIYISFGPLPWQLKKPIHYFALLEMIPWYILFLFIIKGIYQSIKNRNKLVFPLILFSLMVLVSISIFVNNFGIITRIRVPAFIVLLSLIPLGYTKYKNKELSSPRVEAGSFDQDYE